MASSQGQGQEMEHRAHVSVQSYCPLDQADGGEVSGSGSREWRLMIFVVVEEVKASDSIQFYIDQVQQKQGRDLTPRWRSPKVFRKSEEINRFGKCIIWDHFFNELCASLITFPIFGL